MTTGLYAADHASALADLRAAGAAVTFTSRQPGNYDPDTDTQGAPVVSTVAGYAIRTKGNPIRYQALELTQSEAPTLLFVPTTYGTLPALGAEVTIGGRQYTAADVDPVGPDGVAIMARVIVAGGNPTPVDGIGVWTLPEATFSAQGALIFTGAATATLPAATFDALAALIFGGPAAFTLPAPTFAGAGDNGVPIDYAPGDSGLTLTRASTATYTAGADYTYAPGDAGLTVTRASTATYTASA